MSANMTDVISSQEIAVCSSLKSHPEHSHHKAAAPCDSEHDIGFFQSLSQVLFCSRRRHDDADSSNEKDNNAAGDMCTFSCLHWFCCTSRHPHSVKSEMPSDGFHNDQSHSRSQWSTSPVACTSSSRHRTSHGHMGSSHHRKCLCGGSNNCTDSGTMVSSRATDCATTTMTVKASHSSDIVMRHSAKDSTVRSKTVRRVLLADAEYGHATAIDDCIVSDSDAWSRSTLSNSRPNSGDAGAADLVLAAEFGDELSESINDDGEDDEMDWPGTGVVPLPVPPVYDQVKEPSANWSLASELRRLVQFGWYWGPITRVEAEEKLAGQEDGTFLVRDSSDDHYLLSLSFRSYGRTLHTRIEHCQGSFSLYSQSGSDGYQSIVELIERSVDDSRTGVFCYSRARALGSPSFPVRLTRPVSRFTQVRTLQYLCRFLIRQYTRVDHIQQLPLPMSIKGWLEERPY